MRLLFIILATFVFGVTPVYAQNSATDTTPIAVDSSATDAAIATRLSSIFSQLSDTQNVGVSVESSVVTLSGEAANTEAALHAVNIARRLDGVVAVQDNIVRTLDVTDNVAPVVDRSRALATQFLRSLPLIGAALGSLILIYLLGRFFATRTRFIQRITKNVFLTELVATAIRVGFIMIGLIVALNILGATALIGTVLGGAGIIGIALGFGVRDTVENYIASLLLSIRQPFRAEDHVMIDGQEGIVVRLNTRATILMTLDGNHLRIPNAKVFKADILNYSTNPTRRFTFGVGVDSADDPVAAIALGVKTLTALPFILDDPEPMGMIKDVGDSSILIDFFAWVDQRETGFASARSQAIRDVKVVLEDGGFSLPEPLYRVRVDGGTLPAPDESRKKTQTAKKKPTEPLSDALNLGAELTIIERVAEERKKSESEPSGKNDLLSDQAPTE
jgi:small-conductance mechanosensitive channel